MTPFHTMDHPRLFCLSIKLQMNRSTLALAKKLTRNLPGPGMVWLPTLVSGIPTEVLCLRMINSSLLQISGLAFCCKLPCRSWSCNASLLRCCAAPALRRFHHLPSLCQGQGRNVTLTSCPSRFSAPTITLVPWWSWSCGGKGPAGACTRAGMLGPAWAGLFGYAPADTEQWAGQGGGFGLQAIGLRSFYGHLP